MLRIGNLGLENVMVEVETNSEASDYMSGNYFELVEMAKKMGIDKTKAEDLVHDVYASIRSKEAAGNAYNMMGSSEGSLIQVKEYVLGMMKQYSRNVKYYNQTERWGVGKDGREISASSDGEEFDMMLASQKAFATAKSYDDTEMIDMAESVREEVQYVLTFQSKMKLSMKAILANLSYVMSNMDNVDMNLFSELRSFGSEFEEAFRSIVTYALREPEKFDNMVAAL